MQNVNNNVLVEFFGPTTPRLHSIGIFVCTFSHFIKFCLKTTFKQHTKNDSLDIHNTQLKCKMTLDKCTTSTRRLKFKHCNEYKIVLANKTYKIIGWTIISNFEWIIFYFKTYDFMCYGHVLFIIFSFCLFVSPILKRILFEKLYWFWNIFKNKNKI